MKNIREYAYWALDLLKGSPVRKKYKYLKERRDKQYPNDDILKDILSYAVKNVPYYHDVLSPEISAFPVVDKTLIKANYDDFRSVEYRDDSELIKHYTSGSSGTPFKAYQDREKDEFHKAGLILMDQQVGWNIGARWAHMRNWGFGAPATAKDRFVKNLVPLSILNLNDEKIRKIVDTLYNDKRLHIILGYASGLERITDYIVSNGLDKRDYGIRLIIADSDNLKQSTWDLMEKVFHCPVLNRYANIENGMIAITRPNDRAFHVETDSVYVEVLRPDSDISVSEGEMGRVVITDLHNHAMPFIRYDTGDLAVAKKIVNGQCTVMDSLEGREISALYRTDGVMLSETNIMGRFKKFTNVGRYQIIQSSPTDYKMILENTPESENEKCIDELKTIFGSDARITVEHTDLIPSKENGKIRVTVQACEDYLA